LLQPGDVSDQPMRLPSSDHFQRLGRRSASRDLGVALLEYGHENLQGGGLIVYDEHARPAQRDGGGMQRVVLNYWQLTPGLVRSAPLSHKWKPDKEGCPLALPLTCRVDAPAVQLHQVAHDRQSQAQSSVFPCAATVSLAKTF